MRFRRPVIRFPILPRILVFNLLILFLPVASILYLETYERQLLGALEHALVQQGRVLAAALGGGRAALGSEAEEILTALAGRHEARLRIVDTEGRLLADSSRLGPQRSLASADVSTEPDGGEPAAEETFLYRLSTLPVRFYRTWFQAPRPGFGTGEYYSGSPLLQGEEISAALSGRYGAATRISPGGQVSVTLYSAIPIYRQEQIVGAVLVSQSTFRILGNLYELRLDIVRIFLISLVTALLLSLIAGLTITTPLAKLRRAALRMLDPRGEGSTELPFRHRGDEIGDLSRSLDDAGRRITRHIAFIESFASDVAHEVKNPVASIRSAAELVSEMTTNRDQRYFLSLILRETERIIETVEGMRELSHLDVRLEEDQTPTKDLRNLLRQAAMEWYQTYGIRIRLFLPDTPVAAIISPSRLLQALRVCVENALDFAGKEKPVELELSASDEEVRLEVRDLGPGIPPENREKIFERFFSQRPKGHGHHRGLGLAIARLIVEAHGGSIGAVERIDRREGTVIRLTLPFRGSVDGYHQRIENK